MEQDKLLMKAIIRILLVAYCFMVTGARVIYVGGTNASEDDTCGQVPSFPCRSLNTALGHVTSSTTVVIDKGEYPLHSSTNLSFEGVRNVTLQGPSGSELKVRISCGTDAGLSFFNSSDITIENIEFYGCGVLHPSTSLNSSSSSFLEFRSAFYFLFCENIHFERVTVTHSHGTGLTLYSTTGDNAFHSCNFSYNQADPGYRGGGGVYIEFLVCVPGKPEECLNNSGLRNALLEDNSNAHYTFNDSFIGFNSNQNVNKDTEYSFFPPRIDNHVPFGHGGGIMVYFWNVQNSSVVVSHSEIVGNVAYWGGGVHVEFLERCYWNRFEMHSTIVRDNKCQFGAPPTEPAGTEGAGGGVKLGYSTFDRYPSSYNSLLFTNCNFSNNSAYWGGGGTFKASPEFGRAVATNKLDFVDCLWLNNVGTIAAAMELTVLNFAGSGSLARPVFTDCTFQNNTSPQERLNNKYVGTATVLADDVSVAFSKSVVFDGNNKTALVVENAIAEFLFNCTANFTNNHGRNGGAVGLWGYAYVRVEKYAKMFFINNTARNYGGAIQVFSLGEHGIVGKANCFIQYKATLFDNTTLFYFENNRADSTINRGYSSISAISLQPCLSSEQILSGSTKSNTKNIFCDENWKFVGEGSNCTNQIVTAPSYFNRSSSYHMEVIPGKGAVIPLETYDDKGNLALDRTVLRGWSYSQNASFFGNSLYISDHTIRLKGRSNSNVTIGLETVDPRAIYTEVEVTLLPCPAGFKLQGLAASSMTCVCAGSFAGTVHCKQEDFQSNLRRGYWIGLYNHSGENPIQVVGLNPYTSKAMHGEYSPLPDRLSNLDTTLCAPANRTGILCGACLPNHGIVANSRYFQCIPCTENQARYTWVFYLLTEFLPITIFLVIILFFHINITSGPTNGFVFFAQVLTATFAIDGDGTIPLNHVTKSADALQQVFCVLYSIWNLNFFSDIFPPYCLSPHLDTLGIIALDYLTAAYPLALIVMVHVLLTLYDKGGVIYTICNPIHKRLVKFLRKWDLNKRSIVDAFATFLVLSYTKFTLISLAILQPGILYNDNGTLIAQVVYYNGNTDYFHGKHIPLFFLALFILIFIVIIPPLLLLLYPLRDMYNRWKAAHSTSSSYTLQTSNTRDLTGGRLKQFLETFYSCYKDGLVETTDGGSIHKPTRDYRYFAGVYFLLRMVLFVTYTFTKVWAMHFILQQMILVIAILLFTILRPYKNRWYNNLDATLFGLLLIINVLTTFNTYMTAIDTDPATWAFAVQYVLIFCPLVYLTGYILRGMWKKCLQAKRTRSTTETTRMLYVADSKIDRGQLDRDFLQYYHDVDAEKRDRHVNYYPPKLGKLEEPDSHAPVSNYASDSGLVDVGSSCSSAY